MFTENIIEMGRNLHECFIDYEKDFDRMKYEDILKMLADIGIHYKDVWLVKNLFYKEKAAVKIWDIETECQNIEGRISTWMCNVTRPF